MRICQDHWKALRDEIAKRGLSHLIAKSGEEAAAALAATISKEAPPQDTFDPLMASNFSITSQFLESVPVGERLAAFAADFCPICELRPAAGVQSKEALQRNWIEGSIEDQYQQAVLLGLVTVPGTA